MLFEFGASPLGGAGSVEGPTPTTLTCLFTARALASPTATTAGANFESTHNSCRES